MRAVHGKRDGKANRPFCSRVMKERRVVMKERAIPGPCNCCPRGPRIQYYSMGLAIWTDCIPKRDIYMLCANHGSGQSMDRAAQSMDPCFARAIHGLPSTCAIHGLRNHTCHSPAFVQKKKGDQSGEKGKDIVAYLSAGER